jgi:hypothetical protein
MRGRRSTAPSVYNETPIWRMALAIVLAVLLTPGPGFARALGQQAEAESLKIEVLEGEGSINNIRELTMRSPAVRVLDANGSPVFGATVTFTTPAMGASAIFLDGSNQATFVTNERGEVRVEGMRPNNVVGNFEIRVLANRGRDRATARISQTNAAPSTGGGGGGGGSNRGLLILLIVAGAGAGVAAALGGGSSSSSGSPSTPPGNGPGTPPPPVTITPGAPGFGPP